MKALLIVDVQNDFLPGGSLPVPDGDKVIPVINKLMDKNFDLIIATKDWHPANHGSFASNHHGKKPGQTVILHGLEQILWPTHCVQETKGSEISSLLQQGKIDHFFFKGTDPLIDSYSTFFDNGHLKSTGLGEFLKEKGITDVYIAGLATDYCVKYSASDALKLGFNVHIVADGCRGIDLQEGESERTLEGLRTEGANIITSERC